MRNILAGCRTFSEIAAGAPGLSRALLTKRLHDLQRVGVITARSKPDGRGSLYEPTPAGEGLRAVLHTLGMWADQWMELTYEQADPGAVLWSWTSHYLERDRIPDRRIVIRFEWTHAGRNRATWMLIEQREAEICPFDPGFGDDVVVAIIDPLTFSRWHLGLIDWETALRSGGVEVTGPASLRRALPTWNGGPQVAASVAGRNLPVTVPARAPDAGTRPPSGRSRCPRVDRPKCAARSQPISSDAEADARRGTAEG